MTTAPDAVTRRYPSESASVTAARHLLAAHLPSWGLDAVRWSAELVLTELATNAVLHAHDTGFSVTLQALPGGALRIEVADGSVRVPRVCEYGVQATTGRGVGLVADLSREWGVRGRPGGKTVWCELAPESEERPGRGDEATEPFDLDAFLAGVVDDEDPAVVLRAA